MTGLDATHDPRRRSWVASAQLGGDFPIQNLPLGIFSCHGDATRRFGIAIGDEILDVTSAVEAGLLDGVAAEAARLGGGGRLNALFAAGPEPRQALRHAVSDLLTADSDTGKRAAALAAALLHPQTDCQLHLPVEIGDYTDFFAGIHHARAAGAQFNPNSPLPENYKYVPIAYHGRASSVVPSGELVHRPRGQLPGGPGQAPKFGPCARLDLELEIGFYIGGGNPRGTPISIGAAAEQIVGLCLLNDWSARDIQAWEMMPLGPFLAKNFATTVSPWVVTVEALAPFRIPQLDRPDGDPVPLPYLLDAEDQIRGGFDIRLGVALRSARMRQDGVAAVEVITSNTCHLYWTLAQMVAHHSVGGCNLRPGDLLGTGTISGPTRAELSSMLELTFGGSQPISLPNGEQRGFLEDGDEITLTARCTRPGYAPIGFGVCTGTIAASETHI